MENKFTIGVVVGNADSPHAMMILDGIRDAIARYDGRQIIMVNVHVDELFKKYTADEYNYVDINPVFSIIEYAKPDGLLVSYGTLSSCLDHQHLSEFMRYIRDIPHVIMDRETGDEKGGSIASDNYTCMYDMVEHLIQEHGRKKLICLAGPEQNDDSNVRLQAYKDALRKNAVLFSDDMVAHGTFNIQVQEQLETLFAAYPDADALVCLNDHMASAAYQFCEERGLQVGRDISITGFDDWEVARYMEPPLTTVAQNSYQIGYTAVEELVQLLLGKEPKHIIIPSSWIKRASCGCCVKEKQDSRDAHECVMAYEKTFSRFRQQTWVIPALSGNVMTRIATGKAFVEEVLGSFCQFGARSSYILLYENPIDLLEKRSYRFEGTLSLAAFQHGDQIMYIMDDKENSQEFDLNVFRWQEQQNLCCYSLVSNGTLYGYMAMDIDADSIFLFHTISMQVSNFIHLHNLSTQQREITVRLETTVDELRRKNEVISFISSNDTLTGILNRRGFMEKTIEFITANQGTYAVILYADLNYLKMINDVFGHNAGDFALLESAKMLQHSLPEESIIARIGGDEFAALFPVDTYESPQQIFSALKYYMNTYNQNSEKEYFIELSLGYYLFVCDQNVSIKAYMEEADRMLYEVKKRDKRRTVIKYNGSKKLVPYYALQNESGLHKFLTKYIPGTLKGYALHLDIDDMRGLNSFLGVEKGDMALQVTVRQIEKNMKDSQMLYRIGGDEFILIDYEGGTVTEALLQFRQITAEINNYLQDNYFEMMFSVSGGIVDFKDIQGDYYEGLMQYTDFVLAESKKKGNGSCVIFSRLDYEAHIRRRQILNEMRESMVQGYRGFYVVYHAIFSQNGTIVGAEALMRYYSDTYGNISPVEFIPMLEESGLIVNAGRWVLREALQACKEFMTRVPGFRVGVNVSAEQVKNSNVVEDILRILKEEEVDPAVLRIELTESSYLENDDRFRHFWHRLKSEGVLLALDDFGTGYSNFHYLNELRPDVIKIDHSFTRIAWKDSYEYRLLENMKMMVNNINIKLCIEGIESIEVKEFMDHLSPDYYQGYYWGKPCDKDTFMERYL